MVVLILFILTQQAHPRPGTFCFGATGADRFVAVMVGFWLDAHRFMVVTFKARPNGYQRMNLT